jgi:hypothetical protein
VLRFVDGDDLSGELVCVRAMHGASMMGFINGNKFMASIPRSPAIYGLPPVGDYQQHGPYNVS